MIGRTTPQAAGMPQQAIDAFMRDIKRQGITMHSVLMLRGNNIFYERYWEPFRADMIHRMYSVTKSFVAVAIGCLIDEGKLKLTDRIVDFFPDKQPEHIDHRMAVQTVRDMLMMSTCYTGFNWFVPENPERTQFYFKQKALKYPGTLFYYDSNGSYILGALVERLSGMPLLDYLRLKVLDKLGGFESAQMLKSIGGAAWGDSALLCTSRALMNFARFVMNLGKWDGEQLVSEDFMRAAISKQIDNNNSGTIAYNTHGYGYQIWRSEQNSFSFHGMGGQFAICVPDKDFIFVCTGDNQFDERHNADIFRSVFDNLVAALPGDAPADDYDPDEPLTLSVGLGEASSPFAQEVSGAWFACDPNPMGITRFSLEFDGDSGTFVYENAQGLKRLPFGMKRNVFGKFPQLGYSDDIGNVHELNGFMYDCAASAGWIEEKKLQLRVQVVDRYFGSLMITFGFTDPDTVSAVMIKVAEDFFDEYNGYMSAKRK